MREFRAWDKVRNEYLSGGQILISIEPGRRPEKNNIYLDILKDANKYNDRFIIEQYTGLKDKSGKKIYEGDIVDKSYINPMTNNMVVQHYVVEWEDGVHKMKFINAPHEAYDRHLWMSAKDVEIIGNIHENSKLLKKED